MNSPPADVGSEEAGFTQPRAHLLADPCTKKYGFGPITPNLRRLPWMDFVHFGQKLSVIIKGADSPITGQRNLLG